MKKAFTENISIETMVALTDEMLKFEKERRDINMRFVVLKIVPAVAAIILVIGLVNMIDFMSGNNGEYEEAPAAANTERTTAEPDVEPFEEEADPYAHVRFGETRDILLLDVEWHTAESYAESLARQKIEKLELLESVGNIEAIEELNNYWDIDAERLLNQIAEREIFISKTINGQANESIQFLENMRTINSNNRELAFKYEEGKKAEIEYDENGYFIYNVYPYGFIITYYDENGESQYRVFGKNFNNKIDSRSKFDIALENEAIPICDDLLERGLITQEQYDAILKDPLQTAVERFFGLAN